MSNSASLSLFVTVLLAQQVGKGLDYSVPSHLIAQIQIGQRVEVPLKNQLKKGTISSIQEQPSFLDPSKIRPISRLLAEGPAIDSNLWKLALWMADYYCTPLQKVLRCFLPPNIRKEVKIPQELFVQLKATQKTAVELCQELRRKQPAQAIVLEQLLHHPKGIFLADLLQNVSRSPIDTLATKGILQLTSVEKKAPLWDQEFFPTKAKQLSSEQALCVQRIQDSLSTNQYAAHLIHGVTGSGKTEIYLQAIQTAMAQNKSSLLLVPEIALTSQTIERFRSRFTQPIALLHHRLSLGERSAAWNALQTKEAMLAIGPRSALFCPAKNLGLIIVDEEHDGSYKQSEEAPTYHGRDVAVMRAYIEKATILLGSATPSLESYYNALQGKYSLSTLKTRPKTASLPKVTLVEMKDACQRTGRFTYFAPELLDAMAKRLAAGEQSLLFLNQRGYHRQEVCRACLHVMKCPHCDLALTHHRLQEVLSCHLCDYQITPPRACPLCHSTESLQFKGCGTEQIERALHAIFPDIRTLRMDRDTTARKESHETLFRQFRSHKADVLIGTQMVAKGFDFPSVTLVGILNSDPALHIPDVRSQERVFQLLTQVAGRAGRGELSGEVILQTYLPHHPIFHLAASQDYDRFYATEIEERRLFGYPPFCHLIKLLFSGEEASAVQAKSETIRSQLLLEVPPSSEILPVTAAGSPKIKDRFRFQFLIKTPSIKPWKPLFAAIPPDPHIQLLIDIDPLSTY